MINYIKSAKLNNMGIEELKNWFEKYPQSNRKIIIICDGCGKERRTEFYACYDLCNKCAGLKRAETLKNSNSQKLAVEMRLGGFDLCWHHIAYDFGDPDALRIRITRKFHSSIHHPKGIPLTKRGYSLID